MSFIYTLIALEPDTVLAEHTDYQGNFLQIIRVILKNSLNKQEKMIIEYDNHVIYMYNDNEVKYLTLTEGIEAKEAFAFLLDLKAALYKTLSYDKVIKLSAYQLNFKNQINSIMSYYSMHPSIMKTGESINLLNPSNNSTREPLSSIIEKNNQIGLVVMKDSVSNESATQREVFNIEMAVNEIKSEDISNKQSKGYLVIAGGITAFLMLFYYII